MSNRKRDLFLSVERPCKLYDGSICGYLPDLSTPHIRYGSLAERIGGGTSVTMFIVCPLRSRGLIEGVTLPCDNWLQGMKQRLLEYEREKNEGKT